MCYENRTTPKATDSVLLGYVFAWLLWLLFFWLFFQIARKRKQAKIPQPKNSA